MYEVIVYTEGNVEFEGHAHGWGFIPLGGKQYLHIRTTREEDIYIFANRIIFFMVKKVEEQ